MVISLNVTEDFLNYTGGIYYGDDCDVDSDVVNHAVLAVGMDVDEDDNEFIIVKNSWGTSWGMDGYGWIYVDPEGYGTCSMFADMTIAKANQGGGVLKAVAQHHMDYWKEVCFDPKYYNYDLYDRRYDDIYKTGYCFDPYYCGSNSDYGNYCVYYEYCDDHQWNECVDYDGNYLCYYLDPDAPVAPLIVASTAPQITTQPRGSHAEDLLNNLLYQ